VSDTSITIPADLLPKDGRFGAGPSKVRPEQIEALSAAATNSWARPTARPR
jgi:phosphoserine aminotransferase